MRVAFVYRNFNLTGSLERDAVLGARSLIARGIELHCYCNPDATAADVPGAIFHDVRPIVRSRSRIGYATEILSFAIRATRALRRDRLRYDIIDIRGPNGWEQDVVTIHGVTKAQQTRWVEQAAASYRVPRVRGFLAPATNPRVAASRMIERLQLRPGHYSRVVAVTDDVARDIHRVHHVPPDRVDVVHLPIDLKAFQQARADTVRPALGIDEDCPLLLFVGNDFERKGLGDAIAILSTVPAAHLVVVGGGPIDRYRRLAQDGGVGARTHFIGQTNEPEQYFSAADVLLLPTKEDPWGLTLIEAMAAGVPSVTTAAAGASEVIRKADAGVVVPSGDLRAFRSAVSGLIENQALRAAMGARGRLAAERFGPAAHADAIIRVWERVVEERARRPTT